FGTMRTGHLSFWRGERTCNPVFRQIAVIAVLCSARHASGPTPTTPATGVSTTDVNNSAAEQIRHQHWLLVCSIQLHPWGPMLPKRPLLLRYVVPAVSGRASSNVSPSPAVIDAAGAPSFH